MRTILPNADKVIETLSVLCPEILKKTPTVTKFIRESDSSAKTGKFIRPTITRDFTMTRYPNDTNV